MRHLLTALYLLALMGYVLAGTPDTPFHADESTLVYTTRDYFDQFVARDFDEVTNRAADVDPMDINLRLLDGRVQKYLGGLAYHLVGGTAAGLNLPWDWGADYAYNQSSGRVPPPDVLMPNRWAMALLLALCVPAAFGIGMSVGGWPMALVFPALIALSPNILINGRRAMMEAPLLLASLLTVLSAVRWAGVSPHPKRGIWLILLSLAAGLALSSKHSGALTLVPVFGALGVLTLWRRDWRGLVGLFAAGVGAIGVFFAFNPAWWPDPLGAAADVLRLRSELLSGQTAFFGGYDSFGAQVAGFWRQTFIGAPQYYEIDAWAAYIPDQIARYEATPWGGLSFGALGGVVLVVFAALGVVSLVMRRSAAGWVFAAYAVGVILAALLLTPLEWARYYLIGLPGVYGMAALGVSFTWHLLRGRSIGTAKTAANQV